MAASALRPIETDDDAAGRTGTGFSGGQGRAGAPPRMEAESLQPKPWRDVHPCRGRNNRFGIRVHREHMARPAPEKPKADCIPRRYKR